MFIGDKKKLFIKVSIYLTLHLKHDCIYHAWYISINSRKLSNVTRGARLLRFVEASLVHPFKAMNGILIVNVVETKTKVQWTFTITCKYYDFSKKIYELRSKFCHHYFNGKCTIQNIGIKTFCNLGRQIATYLNPLDTNLYIGHYFRRTSVTVLVHAGGDIIAIKHHDGRKSNLVVKDYFGSSE